MLSVDSFKAGGSWLTLFQYSTFKMICNENIHRIVKYFLFIVLILIHLCFAKDEIVPRSGDDDEFLQFSASRRPYYWEGTSFPDYHQNIDLKSNGLYYKTVFFVVLGIGLTIFIGLLFVCKKVATVFEGANTPSVIGATIHPPNTQATYNVRVPEEIRITASYVNSAYSGGPFGRSEVDSSGSDRPPDYTMVAKNDGINRNSAYPQVVTTHIETPPPKYEDGGPVFR